MARRESQAVAGFYATPPHLLPLIAAPLRPERWRNPPPPRPNYFEESRNLRLVDPCAGEGVALRALVAALAPPKSGHVETFACEMETTRHAILSDGGRQRHHLLADFFTVRADPGSMDLLYLNPPYDTDRRWRRLEARWLHAATPLLVTGGVLVFVVPHYALTACASLLARHYEDLRGYRFPGRDFEIFKQIVLYARKTVRAVPEPRVAAWCEAVGADATLLPDLSDTLPRYEAPTRHASYSVTWESVDFDLASVATLPAWSSERGPLPDLSHPPDLLSRHAGVYPVAQPPRPIHLASALAAGVFNGLRVEPNDPRSPLPPLLVKGTFTRAWDTVDERHDKDGHLTSETQAERPELRVWVLDLRRGTYHEIVTSSVETPHLSSIEGATFADLLAHYSRSLLAALRASCPVQHDPALDPEPPLPSLARPLWRAQNSVLHATAKTLDTHGGAIIVGEVGTGKTGISVALTRLRGSRRALVQAPPHLLTSWAKQIAAVAPDVAVVTLQSVSDIRALRDHAGPVIALLSREAGKLGHAWRGVAQPTCPRCGSVVNADRLAERRARCSAPVPVPRDAILSRWLSRHLWLLLRARPQHPALVDLLPRTPAALRWHAALQGPRVDARLSDALVELVRDLRDAPAILDAIAHRVAWAAPERALDMLALLPVWSPERPSMHDVRAAVALAVPPGNPTPIPSDPHPDEHGWSKRSRAEAWAPWVKVRAWVTGAQDQQPVEAWRWGEGHKGSGKGFGRGTLWGAPPASEKSLDDLLHVLVEMARHDKAGACGEPLYQADPRPRRYPLGAYITRHEKDLFDMVIFDEAHELANDASAQGIMFMRLAQMAHKTGAAVLCLTGSVANGYAESLFNVLWATSPNFRGAFSWKDRDAFIDRYGLRKRVVVHDSKGLPLTITRGATSERILGRIKPAGCTPGVLPTLLLEHLLRVSAILHKSDLDLDLPVMVETCPRLDMPADMRANLDTLLGAVKFAIGKTRYLKDVSGRLFGALTGLLSYPDLAPVGTEPDGSYALRWPLSTPHAIVDGLDVRPGGLIACVPPLADRGPTPKERMLIETVRADLAAGRGSLVLPIHVVLLDRYAALLREAGIDVLVLDAAVDAKKREDWIDRHLVAKKRRVLLANPLRIQTGLNNLVTLQTAHWMENPGCNPIIDEQGNGRLHRPGQTGEVRVVRAVYDHPLTLAGFRLLLHKIGVVRAVNGLSPEAVYAAAGIGDDLTAGLSVGQELYRMLVRGA